MENKATDATVATARNLVEVEGASAPGRKLSQMTESMVGALDYWESISSNSLIGRTLKKC